MHVMTLAPAFCALDLLDPRGVRSVLQHRAIHCDDEGCDLIDRVVKSALTNDKVDRLSDPLLHTAECKAAC